MIDLYNGDCLEIMKDIPEKSIDMILCDLPYGTTACKWDIVIPFEALWKEYKQIVKKTGVIALFGSEPFSSNLRMSNINNFLYDWIWEKEQGANFMLCKYQPYKVHEIISIFSNRANETIANNIAFQPLKNYFYKEREKSGLKLIDFKNILGNQMASHYFTKGIQWSLPKEDNYKKLQETGYFQKPYEEIKKMYEDAIKQIGTRNTTVYFPQMTKGKPYITKGKGTSGEVFGFTPKIETINKGERYPRSIIKFNKDKGYHPTQKPVGLLEYLIKTYTQENEIVLDNCMGSGSTGVACINTNRQFIGIEKDKHYFDVAKERIEKARQQN